MSQTNEPPKKSPGDVMREMRLKQLSTKPGELGQKPTPEFPRVCAVVMDWPLEGITVTAIARTTGDASLYTTGTFGVLGGIGHETVRSAATNCVKVAEKHFGDAKATKEYPYPVAGRVTFYLVSYDGVRVIEGDLESLSKGKDKCSDLFEAAQQLISELRLVTQEKKGEKR